MRRRDFLKGFAVSPAARPGAEQPVAARQPRESGSVHSARGNYQSDPRVVPDTGWPMYQADAGNTGYTQNETGPVVDPTRAWNFRPEDNISTSVAVANGTAVCGDAAGNVYGLAADTGDESWRFEAVGELESMGPAMTEELAVIGSSGGTMYGLDLQNGEEQWRFEAGGSRLAPAPPTVANGVVYVCGEEINAVDVGTGEKRWGRSFKPSPNIAPAATSFRVYVPTFRKVMALKPADGTHMWEFTPEGSPTGVSAADGTVYVSDDENTVYAIEGRSGEEQWRFETGETAEMPAVAGDTVYVASNHDGLYALAADSGSEQWHFEIPDNGSAQAPPLVTERAIYLTPSDDMYTYALSLEDGSRRWRTETGQAFDPMAVADGILYVSAGFRLMALRSAPNETETAREQTRTDASSPAQTARTTSRRDSSDDGPPNQVDRETSERERGFFSNSGDSSGFLSNPFNLTTLGFLLSVAGIAYQLLEGR